MDRQTKRNVHGKANTHRQTNTPPDTTKDAENTTKMARNMEPYKRIRLRNMHPPEYANAHKQRENGALYKRGEKCIYAKTTSGNKSNKHTHRQAYTR